MKKSEKMAFMEECTKSFIDLTVIFYKKFEELGVDGIDISQILLAAVGTLHGQTVFAAIDPDHLEGYLHRHCYAVREDFKRMSQ